MKIYVTVVEVVKKKERGDEIFMIKGGKISLSLSYFVCKISFPVMHLMPYYAKIGHSWPLIA
jgi:hypothetical protein